MNDENTRNTIVTILIITRNRAKLLARAIESALNQTFPYFELLVIDGDSDDNTREVVENFVKSDVRVKYIWHSDEPPQKCFNDALTISKGKYIAVLDDDDEFYPTKIEKQVVLMERGGEKLGVVYCWEEYFDDTHQKITEVLRNKNRGNVYELLLNGPGTGGGTQMLIRKSALSKVGGFDESIKVPSDLQLRLNIAQYYDFDFVPEILIRTHVNHIYQRTTNNIDNDSIIELHKKMLIDHSSAYHQFPEKKLWHLKTIFLSSLSSRNYSSILFAVKGLILTNINFELKAKFFYEFYTLLKQKIMKRYRG